MKVRNTEDKITLRGVDFYKNRTVDLTDNPSLYAKVMNLAQFEAVGEGDEGEDTPDTPLAKRTKEALMDMEPTPTDTADATGDMPGADEPETGLDKIRHGEPLPQDEDPEEDRPSSNEVARRKAEMEPDQAELAEAAKLDPKADASKTPRNIREEDQKGLQPKRAVPAPKKAKSLVRDAKRDGDEG